MNKPTIALISICFLASAEICFAQDKVKARIETVRQFARDLQGGKSDGEIFKLYLESAGDFHDHTVRQTATGWNDLLRESLKKIPAGRIEVYKYTDHPETRKPLKPIEGPAAEVTGYVPLAFELHTNNKIVAVETDDLYVLKLDEEKVYVLFNGDNNLITYFGLLWGHKVALMQF
ncbi:MAG TPA: hypothetical protein VK508_18610 [Cyclobacteriaceae bacterium]|nr:hypothetical protein [Cyclobacteriaceae bacterium]